MKELYHFIKSWSDGVVKSVCFQCGRLMFGLWVGIAAHSSTFAWKIFYEDPLPWGCKDSVVTELFVCRGVFFFSVGLAGIKV